MKQTDRTYPTTIIALDSALCIRIFALASLGIVWLGALREAVVFAIGADSFEFGLKSFSLDGERNLLAWYSSVLMVFSAVLMIICGLIAKKRLAEKTAPHWFFLSLIFIYMSIDESVAIHEHFSDLRHTYDLTGVFFHAWVVIAIPVVLATAAIFTPFLFRVRRKTAIRLIFAGGIYVAGALGMELISGIIYSDQMPSLFKVLSYLAEETLEVSGLTLLIRALVLHLAEEEEQHSIAFE